MLIYLIINNLPTADLSFKSLYLQIPERSNLTLVLISRGFCTCSKTIDNTYQDILKRHRCLYSMAFKYILISIIDRFATNTSPHAALLFESFVCVFDCISRFDLVPCLYLVAMA